MAAIGPKGFSEPEETALATYIKSRGNVLGYIDFHSYSQLWMTVCLEGTQKCTFDHLIDKVACCHVKRTALGLHHRSAQGLPGPAPGHQGYVRCHILLDFVATISLGVDMSDHRPQSV